MILYGSLVSPFVRKVQAYLAERGIEADLVQLGIGDPNPDFAKASPLGKMPAFLDGDFGIADSSAIITYLETKYPGSTLVPESAEGKARVHWFDKYADTVLAPTGGKIFFNRVVAPKFMGREGNEAVALEGEAELPKVFDYLESVIPDSGYLVEDRFTLADLAVATILGNICLLGAGPKPAQHPRLSKWVATIFARPSIAPSYDYAEKFLAKLG